ncbi:MAG: hypothetical protein JNK05_30220 [Myxococcales bacterium]|nr:hypothetical protein [Myxococcales bacterium]
MKSSSPWFVLFAAASVASCEGELVARPDATADVVRSDGAIMDAASDGGMDATIMDVPSADAPSADASCSLPAPVAQPPAALPSRLSVVESLAAERPDWLEASCPSQGGDRRFLFELVRRLRESDPRWGLDRRTGALSDDIITYFYGTGCPEGSREAYMVDVIGRLCPRPGVDPPAVPVWIDRSGEGPVWTLMGFAPGSLPDASTPPDVTSPPTDTGVSTVALPNGAPVVEAVARERPELLRNSCVDTGGNNEFLFEVVRRLRRMDPRWGLNWKRGRVGDMSQDVVDYYRGPAGGTMEGSTDVHIVDIIGGHCGGSPSPAWIDVTAATAMGGTIGRWTLAGRTDL